MQKVKEKSNWKGETIVEIEIERLKAFRNHPFQVRDDDDLEKLKESIKMYGILTPLLGFQKPDELRVTLATIMAKIINEEEIDLSKVILHHEEGVDLIPGNIELSGLEVQLSNVLSRELILKEFVDSLRDSYDYILIDCAPSLGMMTINALVAADEVIIPVQAAYLPVKGLQQLMKTINMVKRRLNKKLQIDGILLAMVDYRTTFARNISAELFTAYGESVGIFENYIPSSIKAVEASSAGISIYKHDPKAGWK